MAAVTACAHQDTYDDGISRFCDTCGEIAWFDATQETWRHDPRPTTATPTDDGWTT